VVDEEADSGHRFHDPHRLEELRHLLDDDLRPSPVGDLRLGSVAAGTWKRRTAQRHHLSFCYDMEIGRLHVIAEAQVLKLSRSASPASGGIVPEQSGKVEESLKKEYAGQGGPNRTA